MAIYINKFKTGEFMYSFSDRLDEFTAQHNVGGFVNQTIRGLVAAATREDKAFGVVMVHKGKEIEAKEYYLDGFSTPLEGLLELIQTVEEACEEKG